jgi:centractin
MSLKTPIIIDLGSYEIKTGFRSNNPFPSTSFPSYIGEPKYDKILRSINIRRTNKKDYFAGDNCSPYLGVLKLYYPIQHGAFTNERDISLIFNHIFSKLGLEPDEIHNHPLLITEPILNPKDNREKISQILFEKYGVPGLIFGSQPPLSLFSLSSTSGIVLESGDGVSQICAMADGYAIPSSFIRSNFGGGDVNEYLRQILKMKGVEFISDTEKLLLHEIKKKYVFYQLKDTKFDEERNATYKLPDSRLIEIDQKEYFASKVMFIPSLVGKNCLGLHQMVATCIEKVNSDLRERLCTNIKLTGGNSLMRNMGQVMHTELHGMLNKYKGINVKVNQNNCTISSWNGGNIVAGLGILNDLLITKKDWDEKGKDIVHKQTF